KTEDSFECRGCKAGFQELEEKCVAFCEEGTESRKKSDGENKKCAKTEDSFECRGCKAGFQELEEKCVDFCNVGAGIGYG
uniref:hypothetical protein n=1 Tax=Staphylococcus aureus TaxID=1280 RepID=UPI0038B407AA